MALCENQRPRNAAPKITCPALVGFMTSVVGISVPYHPGYHLVKIVRVGGRHELFFVAVLLLSDIPSPSHV